MIEGVINELSGLKSLEFALPVAKDEATARQLMSGLVRCISEGKRQKYLSALRVDRYFVNFEITAMYPISTWMYDRSVDRDERLSLLQFTTATPYLELSLNEVKYKGKRAAGFGSCLVSQSVAISWASEHIWLGPEIKVEILGLSPSGELESNDQLIRNVSKVEHWTNHSAWIRGKYAKEIRTGPDLIERLGLLFPHLGFGPLAVKQLRELKGTERFFQWIVEGFESAENEVIAWMNGPFPHNRLPGPASGESRTVMDSTRLRSLRLFETDDGRIELMEHHMKNLSENQRIHYIFEPSRSRLIIGYVGEHLETAQY